ncbi:MAG: hypothetical protein MRY21_04015 [Simkaniaceae bacterium]|nr:hypothetical protein [Simkaniaceae bacterium]
MKYLLPLFVPLLLFSAQKKNVIHEKTDVPYHPWFTGTFLTPTPVNMEIGHPAIEPSVAVFYNYGTYNDDWGLDTGNSSVTINPYIDFQFATTKRTGIEIQVQTFTNIRNGKATTNYADTNVLFGYQVADDVKNSWIPDFRFLLEVVFPTGRYQKLDPTKRLDDATGEGAYFVAPNLAFQKLFYLPHNFFILHWAFAYFFPASQATVRGYSLYGGGPNTSGKIRPGQYLTAYLAGEYSLSQNLVLSFETEFFYQLPSSTFTGRAGTLPSGEPATVGTPASSQWVILPELEYSFNEQAGLVFGGWFTLLGRNNKAFASSFLAFLYVF